jgi:hypothetical protein
MDLIKLSESGRLQTPLAIRNSGINSFRYILQFSAISSIKCESTFLYKMWKYTDEPSQAPMTGEGMGKGERGREGK